MDIALDTPLPSSPTPDPSCAAPDDPPPPYPSRERRTRRNTRRSSHSAQHTQFSSAESDFDALPSSPQTLISALEFPGDIDDEDGDATETTPFLLSPRGVMVHRQSARARAVSHTSTMRSTTSSAPSLAQTAFSLFAVEPYLDNVSEDDSLVWPEELASEQRQYGFFTRRAWKRYFRPMVTRAYYKALLHIMVINFPYALAAWLYLFIFTLSGTALLMVLPLGAIFCFLDILGARAFARGELALQARFHGPLAYVPYPPRPIFVRPRTPTTLEIELAPTTPRLETSFYKNTRAMFTDPTSYQALFYFLVIKPGITLVFTVLAFAVVPAAFALVLPAPAVMRAMRRLGIWQANIAMEGLYIAVR